MKLIIGLGNPGKQYANTRHNAGFIILDEIQKSLGFPEFSPNKKFEAEISEGVLKGVELPNGSSTPRTILVKPATFMNRSGQCAQAIAQFYKIALEDITVLHDDLDIKLGEFKISSDSSSAGHNGVQSIFDTFATQKISRIRIGIEGAEKKLERQIPGDEFVLQNFSEEELETVKKLAEEIQKKII